MIQGLRKFTDRIVGAGLSAYTNLTGYGGWGYFDALSFSRGRSEMRAVARDAKDTFGPIDRLQLLAAARRLKENVGFVKGAVRDIRKFSIGEGIRSISFCEDLSVRDAYDEYFDTWSEIGEVTQKYDGRMIDCMLSEAIDIDGDIGIVLTETSGKYPQIQVIEGHCIGDGGMFGVEEGYWDGVKLNSLGRPVAYRIKTKIGSDDKWETVLARDFIHLFDPSRMSSVRGISGLAHGIHHIIDKRDTLALLKLGIKVDSAMGVAIIGSNSAQPTFGRQTQVKTGAATDTGAANAPQTYEEMQGGAVFRLDKGQDVKTISSDRPSPNVQTFLHYIDRDVANGLHVPIEFVWDSSSLGGSGNRLIIKKAERTFSDRQRLLIRAKRRIRNYVIAKGINRGDLPYVEDWYRCRFQTPSRLTVDVGREADANREDVFAGLRTEQEDYSERGLDLWEARDDIQEAADDLLQRAVELMEKYGKHGLTFDQAIQIMVKKGNSGSAPANQQNNQKPEAKGTK